MFRTHTAPLIALLAIASPAFAQGDAGKISLKAVAEVEVAIEKENGEVELRRVPAEKVLPGDDVIYTITAENVSNEAVSDVVITDPIPEHTTYKDGSAFGDDTEITFSVDGGKRYDTATKLEIKGLDGKVRPAVASDYTHVRWKFTRELAPGTSKSVRFYATLE